MRRFILGCVAVGFAAGCGGTLSGPEQCKRIVGATCKRAFKCDPASAKSLYGDESTCQTTLSANLDCAHSTPVCQVDSGAMDRCTSDLDAQACTATDSPASCDVSKLCPGQLACSGVSVDVSSSTGCTFTLDHCTDGHAYGVNCPSTSGSLSCSCQVDGVSNGKSFTTSTDPCSSATAKAEVKMACGFPYQ